MFNAQQFKLAVTTKPCLYASVLGVMLGVTACGEGAGNLSSAVSLPTLQVATNNKVAVNTLKSNPASHKNTRFAKVSGHQGQCVQDKRTGLMWEVKQTTAGLHHKDNIYTWYNTDNATNGGNAGEEFAITVANQCVASSGKPCNTQALVEAVNKASWCGFNDWRLPTREELRSIVDYNAPKPVDATYFPNTADALYWSSSPDADDYEYAWGVNFKHGYDDSDSKSSRYRVRLVRVAHLN